MTCECNYSNDGNGLVRHQVVGCAEHPAIQELDIVADLQAAAYGYEADTDLLLKAAAEIRRLEGALEKMIPELRASVYSCGRQAHIDLVRIAEAALKGEKE